ncbi:DNA methyltransferase [Rhodococcus sp. 5A-K4]|uniref:DNA methyltransferase n=1 Tax=Rhodococcus sp. 5A-K4 TaxID=3384442 RepID=UPI0038D51006
MARQTRRNAPTTNAADLHRGWLELVDTEGPFLAIPPLKRVWPNGIPDFRKNHPDRFGVLVDARKSFESAWEALDRALDYEVTLDSYRTARDVWIETVLCEVAGWAESLSWGEVPAVQAQSPNRIVTVTAQAALRGADGIGALVHVVDPVDSLRQTPSDVWAATPVDRLEVLLRENKSEIGIVTDGRWWGLVFAREGSMAASGIVDALTWVEEPRTRDAFLTLIGRQHIIGGEPSERLPVLFEESVAAAEEITEALGGQVRSAVELLIQSFSESAADARRRGLPDPLPARTHDTYEAAVTVMMRVVFLLFAEERGLLPTGELFEQGYGISRDLARLVARESEESEEALDAMSLTWHRLLATSSALYSGASFESMRMPAYGGSLFDPARFPFLTALNEQGTLAITVTDRVMLHVLRSVQLAVLKGGEARQISFRDIDVEQIGYIYEGLLGYTCATVDEVHVGLLGKTGEAPEIPLSKLEELSGANPDPKKLATAIREWVAEDQPSATLPSTAAIAKAMIASVDPSVVSALAQAMGDNQALRERVRPWLGLVRSDLRKHPFVVLAGGLLVKETPSRKNAGAHYTPKSLAEEVVLHALQPLCYSPGPHQTAAESAWKLKFSDELLDLKVVDIACGSGAFLVAAARYLADRVVEAWISEDSANSQRNDLYIRAIRNVVANCLYGADINDMAVEMCKLSLWLVSLDRNLPFSFVDDKVFIGNSLLGLTRLEQIRQLHIDPSQASTQRVFDMFDVDIDDILRKAVDLRRNLATVVDDDDPTQSATTKRRQLTQLNEVTGKLSKISDGVIAAGLLFGGKAGKPLDEAYENLREAVRCVYPTNGTGLRHTEQLDSIIRRGLTPSVQTDYELWRPLHWVLAAPDVTVERGGFDAVIGNPPFLAGKKIATAYGPNIESWIKLDLRGQRGAADLVAHFIRRAWALINDGGSLGLIATDRVSQGDTAMMSNQILADEGQIYRAVSEFRWPGKASTGAAIIWASKGNFRNRDLPVNLDGAGVPSISPSLADGREADISTALALTLPFLAGKGIGLYGEGFVLDADDPMISTLNDQELQALRPFVNGQSLLSGSSSGRVAIDAGRFKDETALVSEMPALAKHLQRTVKPLRDAITSQIHERRYWAFWDKRDRLISATQQLDRFIVIARDTRVPVFVFASDHESIYSDKVVIIATDSPLILGILSSTVHAAWFERTRTSRGSTSCYIVSRCLRTFPLPPSIDDTLLDASLRFSSARDRALAELISVTRLYNLVDDPAVNEPVVVDFRNAQRELDHAVCRSYGWNDLSIEHGFFKLADVRRFTCSSVQRAEMCRRLLVENGTQAAKEEKIKSTGKRRASKRVSEESETLFS